MCIIHFLFFFFFFGRRTGKIIEKKRNINNGVDNFEDYLSSGKLCHDFIQRITA